MTSLPPPVRARTEHKTRRVRSAGQPCSSLDRSQSRYYRSKSVGRHSVYTKRYLVSSGRIVDHAVTANNFGGQQTWTSHEPRQSRRTTSRARKRAEPRSRRKATPPSEPEKHNPPAPHPHTPA